MRQQTYGPRCWMAARRSSTPEEREVREVESGWAATGLGVAGLVVAGMGQRHRQWRWSALQPR